MKAVPLNTRYLTDILNHYNNSVGTNVNLNEIINPPDIVSMDVPLFIRMLEWAKEDAKTDMELHSAVENILRMNRQLSMTNYNDIIDV